MLSLLLVSFVTIEALIIIEGKKNTKEIETSEVDYLIVLGARLYWETPSPALVERLKVAAEYSKKNENVKIVVSGGQGSNENIPEAFAMEKYLVDNGIEKGRIIKEDKSTSTFENLKFSIDKIKEIDARSNKDIKLLIVTNKFHIFRSKFLARRFGLTAYGLPAEIPPSVVLNSYFREYFAVIKSILFDRV